MTVLNNTVKIKYMILKYLSMEFKQVQEYEHIKLGGEHCPSSIYKID